MAFSMARLGKLGPLILGPISAVFFVLVFIPVTHNTYLIGFHGKWQDQRLVITSIESDSPAQLAGLRVGDVVSRQGNSPTAQWRQWYQSDLRAYLNNRYQLRDTDVAYEVNRDAGPITLRLTPRPLSGSETWAFYGFRTVLMLFLMGLAVYIVVSKSREWYANVICMCFCFAVMWLATDEPYWELFYSPLIRGATFPLIYIVDLLEILFLQLVMSILVHISLVFPERRQILRRYPWIPVFLYILSITIPFFAILFPDGGLLNKISATYLIRLSLNTGLLVLATLLMLVGYRQCRSPAQRERTRWIIVSMAIVAFAHLVLWNLPILFVGEALIHRYDWLLVPVALVPLSITLSITNHELFGVRGIIRGRIKLLQTMLKREKTAVMRRDQRIHAMTQELGQLTVELEEYELAEQAGEGPAEPTSKMSKLEARYPQLGQIRKETLIGVSTLWEDVFEQAAVAARGTAPVMIVGESGTGKTHIAQTVHLLSDHSDGICKEISCAQFEHADPAFALGKLFGVGTGHGLPNVPKEGQSGLLEESDGGTLFLDDFDRLPLNVQDLLLYPLEGKPFEPGIGRGQPRTVSVKFIFATNRDPAQLVSEGKFQADVLARIGTRVDVPPLRERPEDIPLLVEHFKNNIGKELKHDISVVSPKAMHLLSRYSYARGNARELMSEIHKAIGKAMLEDDNVLRAGYLSEKLQTAMTSRRESAGPIPTEPAAPSIAAREIAATTEPIELATLRRHRFQIKPAEEELGLSHKSRTLSNHLRGLCIKTLSENDWDLGRAARSLSESDDSKIVTRIEGKMRRYLKNIEDNVGNHSESKLYNNLPAAYHEPLAKAIRWVRTEHEAL